MHVSLRMLTICENWLTGSASSQIELASPAQLRAVSGQTILLFWKDHQFGHAQLSRFGRTCAPRLRIGRNDQTDGNFNFKVNGPGKRFSSSLTCSFSHVHKFLNTDGFVFRQITQPSQLNFFKNCLYSAIQYVFNLKGSNEQR